MPLNITTAVECKNCALYQTAKVLGLETPDCSSLNRVVLRNHPVAKNEILYQEGEPFRYLYLIHSGSCVSNATMLGQHQRVMGFYLPGEIAGFENIGQKTCNHTTRVLEKGSICQLDFSALDEALSDTELINVQKYLLSSAAQHSRQLQWERSLTGMHTAEQRVAAFLLNIANRLDIRGFSALKFRLPMSRDVIADYLGLAMETVIRTLKSLESKELISTKAKNIEIIDLSQMNKLLTD